MPKRDPVKISFYAMIIGKGANFQFFHTDMLLRGAKISRPRYWAG
jgi:hypothetical protein